MAILNILMELCHTFFSSGTNNLSIMGIKIDTDIVNKRNIVSEHIRGKGFHPKPYCDVRVVLNFKVIIRKF